MTLLPPSLQILIPPSLLPQPLLEPICNFCSLYAVYSKLLNLNLHKFHIEGKIQIQLILCYSVTQFFIQAHQTLLIHRVT